MLHGLDGGLRGAKGGHKDDGQLGIELADALESLDAVEAAHADVHDDEIGIDARDRLDGLLAGTGGMEVNIGAKYALKRVAHVGFVIHQEHFVHLQAGSLAEVHVHWAVFSLAHVRASSRVVSFSANCRSRMASSK